MGNNIILDQELRRSLLDVLEQYKRLTQLHFTIKETENSGSSSNESLVIEDIKKLGWIPRNSISSIIKRCT